MVTWHSGKLAYWSGKSVKKYVDLEHRQAWNGNLVYWSGKSGKKAFLQKPQSVASQQATPWAWSQFDRKQMEKLYCTRCGYSTGNNVFQYVFIVYKDHFLKTLNIISVKVFIFVHVFSCILYFVYVGMIRTCICIGICIPFGIHMCNVDRVAPLSPLYLYLY